VRNRSEIAGDTAWSTCIKVNDPELVISFANRCSISLNLAVSVSFWLAWSFVLWLMKMADTVYGFVNPKCFTKSARFWGKEMRTRGGYPFGNVKPNRTSTSPLIILEAHTRKA
jgi:hypothetical protein